MDLKTRLKAWREAKGFTRQELAEAAKITPQFVTMMESPRYPRALPSRDTIAKFVEIYEITEARFYGPPPKAKPKKKAA